MKTELKDYEAKSSNWDNLTIGFESADDYERLLKYIHKAQSETATVGALETALLCSAFKRCTVKSGIWQDYKATVADYDKLKAADNELLKTASLAVDAMRLTQRLFQLSDDHALMSACRELDSALSNLGGEL